MTAQVISYSHDGVMMIEQALRDEFAALFAYPYAPTAISDILAKREWRRFELFVAYIFERAGYSVKDVSLERNGNNTDLEIYASPADAVPAAIVQVKLYQTEVSPDLVNAFGGVSDHARGAIGYLIAAGGFTPNAIEQAKKYQFLRLVDGALLLRFITYILGARLPGDARTIISLEALFKADTIKRRAITDTVIMAIANEKGGVGKTTSAINLGTWLGQQGKRVLVIDLDTQKNLTGRMPLRQPTGKGVVLPNMVNYFLGERMLSELILPTKYENVYSIQSHETVKLMARNTSEWTDAFLTFARDLHAPEVRPPPYEAPAFDWILLDTPTADEYRIRLALAAAHVVVAPTMPEIFGLAGLNALFATVESMRALMGSGLGKKGCFMTQCESLKVRSLGDYFGALRTVLGNWQVPLFQSTIPKLKSIETAHVNQRTLFGRRSAPAAAARAYAALGKEIVEYVR